MKVKLCGSGCSPSFRVLLVPPVHVAIFFAAFFCVPHNGLSERRIVTTITVCVTMTNVSNVHMAECSLFD